MEPALRLAVEKVYIGLKTTTFLLIFIPLRDVNIFAAAPALKAF